MSAEVKLKSWQRHIKHTHKEKQGTAWCGAWTEMLWCYLDIDHAAYSAPNDRIQPCPACLEAVCKSLRGEAMER